MGQLLLPRHYLSLQRKSHEPKKTLLYTKLSRINRQAILHLSWSTGSWAVGPAEKRLGQELIRKSDGEEVWAIFNVLKPPERLAKASRASAQPYELQGRQHQHKQKLSLSHQRHGTLLFQLWSPSNLTNASALRDWTVIKQAKCDDSALALAITLRRFSVETAWDGAGPRQAESRCSQHSVFMLFCGGKACRCFCVLCQGWKVLPVIWGSALGDSTEMAHCTSQGIIALCAEMGVLAQGNTPTRPQRCPPKGTTPAFNSSTGWAHSSVF